MGGLSAPQGYAVGSTPRGVAIGDVDGDFIADLASANWGTDDVTVLHGNGDGTFGEALTLSVDQQPWGIVIADLDGNGLGDIATANEANATVTVLPSG